MKFEVLKQYPPNIEQIKKVFNLTEKDILEKGICFAYGMTLFNPSGLLIPHHLNVHELIHQQEQLKIGVEEWWDKYIEDKDFRLEQELMAYSAQYQFAKSKMNNKQAKYFLTQIAMEMSGKTYGFGLDYGIIENKIRNYNKHK